MLVLLFFCVALSLGFESDVDILKRRTFHNMEYFIPKYPTNKYSPRPTDICWKFQGHLLDVFNPAEDDGKLLDQRVVSKNMWTDFTLKDDQLQNYAGVTIENNEEIDTQTKNEEKCGAYNINGTLSLQDCEKKYYPLCVRNVKGFEYVYKWHNWTYFVPNDRIRCNTDEAPTCFVYQGTVLDYSTYQDRAFLQHPLVNYFEKASFLLGATEKDESRLPKMDTEWNLKKNCYLASTKRKGGLGVKEVAIGSYHQTLCKTPTYIYENMRHKWFNKNSKEVDIAKFTP